MVILGFWQLDRMKEKQNRQQALVTRQAQSAVGLDALLTTTMDIRDLNTQFPVTLLVDDYRLLDNRIVKGQVGYEVLVPGVSGQHSVLINLGWLPAPSRRDELPVVDLPTKAFELRGVVYIPESNPFVDTSSQQADLPRRIQAVELETLSEVLQLQLLPFVVQAAEHPPFINNWKPVVMPAEKHLAYAIQWFGLALGALVVGWFAVGKKGEQQ